MNRRKKAALKAAMKEFSSSLQYWGEHQDATYINPIHLVEKDLSRSLSFYLDQYAQFKCLSNDTFHKIVARLWGKVLLQQCF